jgi:uncharacterized membrane protein YphA (DoxX/SURF4 family)
MTTQNAPSTGRPMGWLVLPLRLVLGGLFVFAGVMKVQDTQNFAFAVHGFKLLPQHLEILAAFTLPWIEIVAGAMLLLGLWTRASAGVIGLMTLAFLGGIISVIYREMDVKCSCFGKFEFPCAGAIGYCHVARNTVMIAMAAAIVLWGPGPIAVDRESGK